MFLRWRFDHIEQGYARCLSGEILIIFLSNSDIWFKNHHNHNRLIIHNNRRVKNYNHNSKKNWRSLPIISLDPLNFVEIKYSFGFFQTNIKADD